MNFPKFWLVTCSSILSVATLGATQASALTYTTGPVVGVLSFDGINYLNYSLTTTTDGTLGVIEQENITSLTWTFSIGAHSFTTNSILFNFGFPSAMKATAIELTFDPSVRSGRVAAYSGLDYFEMHGVGLGTSSQSFSVLLNGTAAAYQFLSGPLSLGVVAPAVPEPASWAMMIGGLGLVGAAMRRRQPSIRFT